MLHHTALDPGTVDAILSGDLSPDDAPPGFTAAASLLRTAGGPASDEELVDRAGIVEALAATRPASAAPVADLDAARSRRGMVTAKVAVIGIAAALGLTGVAAAAGLVTHQLRSDDRPVVTDQTTSTTDAVTSDPDGSDGSSGPTTTVAGWRHDDRVAASAGDAGDAGDAGAGGSTTTTAVAGAAGPESGTGASGASVGQRLHQRQRRWERERVQQRQRRWERRHERERGWERERLHQRQRRRCDPDPAAGGRWQRQRQPNAAVPTLPPAAGGNGQGRGNPNVG